MGQVWAAVNESTGGGAALKLLPKPREDTRRRLLREARACGKLRHRNIIDVHDIGETDEGEPFLVMALLTGETLAELLERQRRLDPPHAAEIARDVARALAAAHRAGLVHRDLKPANVFLHRHDGEDESVVKVLDFGVVKDLAQTDGLATVAGIIVGSPAYMSPEQAVASPDLDHRADIWALGVVLFEMLTGKRPFEGDSHQVIMKIMRAPIPSVSQLVRGAPAGLAEIVARCLERDLGRRLSSAAELAEALDRHACPAPPPSSSGDDAMRASTLERGAFGAVLPPGPPPQVGGAGATTISAVCQAGGALPARPAAPWTIPYVAHGAEEPRPTKAAAPPPLPDPARGPGLSSTAPLVRPPAAPPGAHRRAYLLIALGLAGALLAALGIALSHALGARPPPEPASRPPLVLNAVSPPPEDTEPPADTLPPDTTRAEPPSAPPPANAAPAPTPSTTTTTATAPLVRPPVAPPIALRKDEGHRPRLPGWLPRSNRPSP